MAMIMSRYPANWKEISLSRRERAGWKCEWCGAEYKQPHPITGSIVVLSVAHLGTDYPDGRKGDKHDKMDCREENLAALCQRCHLLYDIDEHVANARVTRLRKSRERRIKAGQTELFGDES